MTSDDDIDDNPNPNRPARLDEFYEEGHKFGIKLAGWYVVQSIAALRDHKPLSQELSQQMLSDIEVNQPASTAEKLRLQGADDTELMAFLSGARDGRAKIFEEATKDMEAVAKQLES